MTRIDEVAKAAGVSISTVSYALSGKRPVSVDTRRRVEEAVAALGYRPNAGARMLAGRRTHIFAVSEPLHALTHPPTHMAFALGMSVAARSRDYDILLLTEAEASRGMRRVADSGLADAVLVLDVAPEDERVALAREIGVPVVFVGVPNDSAGLTCVDLDFQLAAARAVGALGDAGHRSIALIGHPEASYAVSNFAPRVRDGFLREAERRGLAAQFETFDAAQPLREQMRGIVERVLSAGATGIVLHNSTEAHEAILQELIVRGLSIPEDVSVVSVGGASDLSRLPVAVDSLPLTPEQSCDLAVDLAARAVAGEPAEAAVHLLAPRYIDNGSLAAPSSR